MEINLLPKAPPRVKTRDKIILATAALVVAAGSYSVVYYLELQTRINNARAELTRVKADNIVLKAERQVPPENKEFEALQASVQQLVDREHQYGEMLDGVAAKMSPTMRVVFAKMDASAQSLDLTVQTETMDMIAEYAQLLRGETWVQDVIVGEIQNATKSEIDKVKEQEGQYKWFDANENPIPEDQLPEQLRKKSDPEDEKFQTASELNKEVRPYEAKMTITLRPNEIPVESDKTDE